jgi:hypothetical protein
MREKVDFGGKSKGEITATEFDSYSRMEAGEL